MKWTVKVEPENDHDEEALRRVSEAIKNRGMAAGVLTLASHLKGDGTTKYNDETVAQVAALCLYVHLRGESDKR